MLVLLIRGRTRIPSSFTDIKIALKDLSIKGLVSEVMNHQSRESPPEGASSSSSPQHKSTDHSPSDQNMVNFNNFYPVTTGPPRPLVICGPSGTGKSTLLKKLMAEFNDYFGFSVSRKFLKCGRHVL